MQVEMVMEKELRVLHPDSEAEGKKKRLKTKVNTPHPHTPYEPMGAIFFQTSTHANTDKAWISLIYLLVRVL